MEATTEITLNYNECRNWADRCLSIVQEVGTTTALDVAKIISNKQPEMSVLNAYKVATQTLSILYRTGQIAAKKDGRKYIYSVK